MGRVVGLFVAPAEKDRRNNINLMRFIAAAAVIVGHMAVFTGTTGPVLCQTSVSSIAVFIFFLLSGYLISTSFLHDGHPFRYLVRRSFRILPGLALVVVASAFIFGPMLSTLPFDQYLRDPLARRYLLNCVLNPQYALPGVFADNPYPNAVNGSLWTLPVEFFMYLVTPLSLVVFKRMRIDRKGILATAVLLGAVSAAIQAGALQCGIVVWGTRLDTIPLLATFFYIGAYVALRPQLIEKLDVQTGFILLLLLTLITPSSSAAAVVVLFLFLPYVVFSFAFARSATFGRVFAENDYSYGVYLWAFPVQQTLVHLMGPSAMSPFAFSCVAFAITVPFAMASWFLVEKPAMALGRRISAWSRARSNRS